MTYWVVTCTVEGCQKWIYVAVISVLAYFVEYTLAAAQLILWTCNLVRRRQVSVLAPRYLCSLCVCQPHNFVYIHRNWSYNRLPVCWGKHTRHSSHVGANTPLASCQFTTTISSMWLCWTACVWTILNRPILFMSSCYDYERVYIYTTV